MSEKLSLRISTDNPDHHLWNNNGTWYLHVTVHRDDLFKIRRRISLKTREVETARRRRDDFLAGRSAEPTERIAR